MNYRGTKALVVGLKLSGMAAVELLTREGAAVRATDLKPLEALPGAAELLGRLGIAFELQTPEAFLDCDLIVTSPDVPADLPGLQEARRRGVRVIGDLELAAPFLKGRTIGITGSNGKTTTTSLTGHILQSAGVPVQVGGNIGKAVAAMVESSRDDGWNVLELSSFQLETIVTFRADIGLALNVTQNHLDRHHTFQKYAAAKGRLFDTQQPGDCAVLNAEDPMCVSYAARSAGEVRWFSGLHEVGPGGYLANGNLVLDQEILMPAADVPIRGRHNLENALAAAIAAKRAGVPARDIAAAIRTFHAVEHRLEFVRTVSGVAFYNDSKATSVDATLKALSAFDGGLWVILGGKDKGLDYTVLREPLAAKARAALLIGAAAGKISQALNGAVPLVESGTLDAAIAHAYARAEEGDTVLLAPACASFDQFRSFEHRGEVFKQIINALEPRN
ncbi:MAG TPA: UDP-N-acetylmuramoyl-L-alanine--D-glutamate ligase [Bryobacteraceae bacterium]|nr:UDP-N-acetylmuramoyl-L-alanine--D-glutamate ligase [Bryobacteraceae bacterium]